jgi:hypothetical protein
MEVKGPTTVDLEELRNLRSLVNSARVCLEGLDSRIKRELEVIGVAKALTEKASHTVNKMIPAKEETPRE